jgi:hypothetical protein
MQETAPMTANGAIDPVTLEQLERLARSHCNHAKGGAKGGATIDNRG